MLEPFLDQRVLQVKTDMKELRQRKTEDRLLWWHMHCTADVEGSAMRQKETQTKEKEVDLKGVKGGSVVKWTKPLKL